MVKIPVITFDGPSGSGKGTLARYLAQQLGWHYLDSGAIYRALAYVLQHHQLNDADVATWATQARALTLSFQVAADGQHTLFCGQEDITTAIRTEAMGQLASQISTHAPVRLALLDRQRAFAKSPGLVTDGRDMGTVVFPDAVLKFYLEASLEVRAERRYQQLSGQGIDANIANVLSGLAERDQRDAGRAASPLRPAEDAVLIDTSDMSLTTVKAQVLAQAELVLASDGSGKEG